MSDDPTGRQVHLRGDGPLGPVTAHIAQVGASLRGLTVGGVDLVPPYPPGAPTPGASGVVLVPWPNRIRDGVWTQRGTTHTLPITEPDYHNASHGLLRRTAYEISRTDDAAVTLSAPIAPTPGYPFSLDTSVSYALTDSGIEAAHRITNRGDDDAPVAVGTHPYVMIGGVATEALVLRSPAATRFEVDERMLPVAEVPVSGDTDLREGRRVGDIRLDTGFGELARDADGAVRHTLTAPDGSVASLWAGPGFDFVQLFITDRYPGQSSAVAIEPMTAPADAFNSGLGLRWLAPGETWELRWGLSYTASS